MWDELLEVRIIILVLSSFIISILLIENLYDFATTLL